jgi:rubrerythrin
LSHHTLKDAISRAIYAEIGAMNFYSRMAGRIENEGGSSRFEQLSVDEKGHRDTLKGWYARLFDTEFVEDEHLIRNSEIRDIEISGKAGAMEALDIAIDAESRANDFYLAEAEKASDPELKKMFESLAQQEKGHYDLLTAEKNALTGGFYWFDMDQSGFLED